ncbi:Protein of unknown function [Pyronema omphalodes CBS 100304]|uniref:Uncharacterized protein n=1 Tax=Pyronema omphalodes (strain CBS 100304) TaxID=1076935 RepID=U4LQJ9_PYROM|nr:Protein of unknown function [Pyronema omphalodes CBS 100304]
MVPFKETSGMIVIDMGSVILGCEGYVLLLSETTVQNKFKCVLCCEKLVRKCCFSI